MLEAMRESLARWMAPTMKVHNDEPLTEEAFALATALAIGSTPPRRGVKQILDMYRDLPQLVQVFGKIGQSFAAIQWESFVAVNPDGSKVRSKKLERAYDFDTRSKMMQRALHSESLVEIPNDPMIDFIDEGNARLTGFECREVMQLHLDLTGECFAWKERGANDVPIRYWPLSPAWVRDVPPMAGGPFELAVRGSVMKIAPEDMIHIKYPDPSRPYGRGVGIGTSLGDELDTDEYAAEWLKSFFFNNATPSLLVAVPNINTDDLKRFEVDWTNKNRGSNKQHRVHMLNKEAKVTKLGADMASIPMVELREFLRKTIAETPGMPPEIIGRIENSNRATIEAATFIFARWLLVPRADRWRMAFQNQVVPDFDKANTNSRRLRIIDYVSPVPEDREFFLKVAKAAPYAVSRGEFRRAMNLEPNAISDDFYLQDAKKIERPINDPDFKPPTPAPALPPAPTRAMLIDSRTVVDVGRSLSARTKANPPLKITDIPGLVDRIDPVILSTRLEPFWSDELKDWGDRTLAELGIEASFNMLNPIVIGHLDEFGGDRIDRINETTREAIREQLLEGVQAGEDHKQISARIASVFEQATGFRAVTIARTESAISANFATWQAHVQSGVVPKREWIATLDGRTRDDHVAMNGVVVNIGDPFEFPDGTQTVAPAQSGDPAQDINCRCTTAAVIIDDDEERGLSPDAQAAAWKAFDSQLISWENRTEREFIKAFDEQLEEIIKALDQLAALRGAL